MSERYKQLMRLARAVRKRKDINPSARNLFTDICELAADRGYCRARPAYFEAEYGVNASTVRRWISDLIRAGVLKKGRQDGHFALFPVERAELHETPQTVRKTQKRAELHTHRAELHETPQTVQKNAPQNRADLHATDIYIPDRLLRMEVNDTNEGRNDEQAESQTSALPNDAVSLLRFHHPGLKLTFSVRERLPLLVSDLEVWEEALIAAQSWKHPTPDKILSRYRNEAAQKKAILAAGGHPGETRAEREERETREAQRRVMASIEDNPRPYWETMYGDKAARA